MPLFKRLIKDRINQEEMLKENMIDYIKTQSDRAYSNMSLTKEPCTPFVSKLNGFPYVPKDFDFPYDRRKGKEDIPLRLLAQVNFKEMPPLPGFPSKGILQFFIACDKTYGLNKEDPFNQDAFRIVYHEQIFKDATSLTDPPSYMSINLNLFPIDKEIHLNFIKDSCHVSRKDFRFEQYALEAYNYFTKQQIEAYSELPDTISSLFDISFLKFKHRFGGYPNFYHEDIRTAHPDYKDQRILLLQIMSEEQEDYQIKFDNHAVVQFFISAADLKNRDFSHVLYNIEEQ